MSGKDILKIVVVERHRGTGNIGDWLCPGIWPERVQSDRSVAHDSHNLVVVGTNDQDILKAVREMKRMERIGSPFQTRKWWLPLLAHPGLMTQGLGFWKSNLRPIPFTGLQGPPDVNFRILL